MINRIQDYPIDRETTSADVERVQDSVRTASMQSLDLSDVKSWIIRNPIFCLAGTFFLGAVAAWFVKRR
jgi:hypothetical protein